MNGMKTLQVTSPTTFEVRDVPIPDPGAGEVRLRVEAVTTCPQWDLHLRHNDPMFVGHQFHYPYTPGQPGHEATGVIDAVGDGVTSVKVGDRVSAWRDADHGKPGCYAQFVLREAENVIRVPGRLPVEAVASLELAMCVATVFRMLGEMNVIRGKTFGVNGLGPAGLIAMQMARAEGAAKVIGLDPVAARRTMALKVGADECFDPTTDVDDALPRRPDTPTIDSGVDCVGFRSSVEFLMDRTSDVVALFGVQREDYSYGVHHRGLQLCGYKGHSRASAAYAVAMIEAGRLDLTPLVTHHLPLERYGEGIDLLERQEAIKVCFLPWADS